MTRPRVTFALLAYNDQAFIAEAVRGALAQSYSPMEIILSDDSSSDGTYAIMEEMAHAYDGGDKLILNRNPRNLGVGGHINRVMELSSGELIVQAAGDDVSLPQRTSKICEAYLCSRRRVFVFCSGCLLIDAKGKEIRELAVPRDGTTLESLIEKGSHVYGCVQAWHRCLFDAFGPLPLSVTQEDEVIPFRSMLLGAGIERIHETLVRYRMHGDNHSLGFNYVPKNVDELQELYGSEFQVKLVNLKCWQRDLETASRLDKGRREALAKKLESKINQCRLELDFRQGKPVLNRALLSGVRAAVICKWVIRSIFPRLYRRWSWARYRPQPSIFR